MPLLKNRFVRALQEESDSVLLFLDDAESDIQVMSNSFSLQNYLSLQQAGASEEALAAAKENLQTTFLIFAQTRLIYDQIRFLDADGQEIVRVDTDLDGNSTIISDDALQNKATRPYFAETVKVQSGEVYISPLELNVERGEIERPFTPVIRYSTPVYLAGELQGVVVTNILADFFLQPLAQQEQNYYLTDENGYFLFHPDPAKQWGRDLETGIVVTQELPDVAAALTPSQETAKYLSLQQTFLQSPRLRFRVKQHRVGT